MKRDFRKWHEIKSKVDEENILPLFRAQEIWWCSLGANVGVETDGKNDLFQRPVVIFRKFNKEMFWGLPLTSKGKSDKPFYFSISFHGGNVTAVLSQVRTLSAKRLIRRMGKLSDKQFSTLEKAMTDFLKETNPLRGSQVPNGNKYGNVSRRF